MQDFNAGGNTMTSSCGDVNSSQHFIDSGSNKTSLNHASKQANNHHIPQLHTLNQLRSQQGLMQQPLVQISSLQLPQQVLQNQFLKPGQPPHIGPVLPTGSFPNIFSALQYQILVQALQQGLIPVPQTSQPVPVMNSVGTSHNSQSSSRLNTSLSSPATSNILKVNGASSLYSKDSSKSEQAVVQSSSTYALPIYPSFGENSAIQASEESLVVSASVGCATADGMASRPFTSIPSSFYLTGISSAIESCNVTNSCEVPLVVSSLRDSLSKQDLSDNQTRMISENTSNLSNANLLQEKTQTSCSKTEVLTHIIEGYIIQEGSRPFPVERSMYINEFLDSENEGSNEMTDDDDDDDDLEQLDTTKAFALKAKNDLKTIGSEETKQCHCCGIFFHPKASVSKTGKFCSVTCSKRTAACSRWMIHYASKGLLNEKSKSRRISGMLPSKKSRNVETDDDFSDMEELKEGKGSANLRRASAVSKAMQLSPYPECSKSQQPYSEKHSLNKAPETSQKVEKGTFLETLSTEKTSECDASMWGVYEVCDFIQSLSGCGMYAEDFKKQEIDGQALLLLTEEHLMSTMNIKLGPALKICSNIRTLKVSTIPCKNVN